MTLLKTTVVVIVVVNVVHVIDVVLNVVMIIMYLVLVNKRKGHLRLLKAIVTFGWWGGVVCKVIFMSNSSSVEVGLGL